MADKRVSTDTKEFTGADIGPLPGQAVLAIGEVYIARWTALAIWVSRADARRVRERGGSRSMG